MKLSNFKVTPVEGDLVKISAKGWNMGFMVEHYALKVTNRFTGEFLGYEFFGIKGCFKISNDGDFIGSDSGAFSALGWDTK